MVNYIEKQGKHEFDLGVFLDIHNTTRGNKSGITEPQS